VEGSPPPTGLQITCSKSTVVKGEDPFHQGADEVASVMYNGIPLHLCPVQSLSGNVAKLVARGQREHPCNKTNQTKNVDNLCTALTCSFGYKKSLICWNNFDAAQPTGTKCMVKMNTDFNGMLQNMQSA